MEKNIPQIQYIVCPECSGTGKNKAGMECRNCGSIGITTFSQDKFYYWGPKMGLAAIRLYHLKRGLHLWLNALSFTAGIIGLAALAVWVYQADAAGTAWNAFAFWRTKSPLILIFWISVAADMFMYYRMSEDQRTQVRIAKFNSYSPAKGKQPDNWSELRKAGFNYREDISRAFSYQAYRLIEDAYKEALKESSAWLEPVHIFLLALRDPEVAGILSRLGADANDISATVRKQLVKILPAVPTLEISNAAKEVLIEAFLEARELGQDQVRTRNLLLAIMRHDRLIRDILYDLEIDMDKIFNVVKWFRSNEVLSDMYKNYKRSAHYKPESAMNRAYTAVATPVLDHYSYDLTLAAKWSRLDFCVDRDNEIEKIFQQFESGQHGVMLIGPDGIGKKTLIYGIAQKMVEEDVPAMFQDKRLIQLDLSRLISGAAPAQAQERMMVVLDEVSRADNIILFLESIESISGIRTGDEESMDLSEVLSGAVERGVIRCLATTDPVSFSKFLENEPLGKAFAHQIIEEPDGNLAIQIIESHIGLMEGKYGVYFSYNAIEEAVKDSSRYIHDKYLPEKALDVLEMAAARQSKNKKFKLVNKDIILEVISEITHIPLSSVDQSEGERLMNLEEHIHKYMIGQEEAVALIADSLRRARAQMREGKRPIASFLFLGPTGVGKTELAKTVAKVYFNSENAMIRLDMSEYQGVDSLAKIIGTPGGNLGYLTEAVRKQPFSLVLLDEFEKAHPQILNLFLQVMDDGRLTDGQGRTVDFTNTIIVATSNAGADFIQEEISKGSDMENIKSVLINEHLNQVMRPELINRFDGIVVFKPLTEENIIAITGLMLEHTRRLLEEKGVDLIVDPAGVAKLAQAGYDPQFGARPLRRLLQDRIENEIAKLLLGGRLKRRDGVVINSEGGIEIKESNEL